MQSVTQRGNPHASTNELFRVPSAITYSVQKHGQDLDVVLYHQQGMKAVLSQTGKFTLKQVLYNLEASEQLLKATKKVRYCYESVNCIGDETWV